MNFLTQLDLKDMAKEYKDFCVSIVMDTEKTITANLKNQQRFEALIKKSHNKLLKTKLSEEKIRKILIHASDLLSNDSFWHDGFDGLAVYSIKDSFEAYKLPFKPKETTTVSHFPYLLPLLFGFNDNYPFHVLVVDEGEIRLFKAGKFEIEEIELNLSYTNEKDYFNRTFQVEEIPGYRSEVAGGRTKGNEYIIYHGHGNAKDDNKIRAKEFFQSTKEELERKLSFSKYPLILAGHNFLIDIFRKANPKITTEEMSITLNPGPINIGFLHSQAMIVIEKLQKREYEHEKIKYCDAIGTSLTSTQPKEIFEDGKNGRIETLFVNIEIEHFGILDEKNNLLTVNLTNNEDDESLTNLACIIALQTDATVLTLNIDQMPENVPFCALYRY